jgi:hypothetical protein
MATNIHDEENPASKPRRIAGLKEQVQLLDAERNALLANTPVPLEFPLRLEQETARPDVQSGPEEMPQEIAVVITAAVAAYLGAGARIQSIRASNSDSWEKQGRAAIMASHQLQRSPEIMRDAYRRGLTR